MDTTIQPTTADSTQTNVAPAGIPAQGQTNVGVTPTVDNVTNTNPASVPGPDAAFAEMRRENEVLKAQAAVAQDPEVVAFLQQREAAKAKAQAESLGVNEEALKRFEAMDQFMAEERQEKFIVSLQENENNFKAKYQMDQGSFDNFVGYIGQTYPEVTQMLQANPSMDLSPYLAMWNPQGFASFRSGTAQPTQAANKPVFVAGHGTGATPASADVAAMKARIAERVKNY